jgi:hypothetical protein
VSIHAQLLRDDLHLWYFALKSRVPQHLQEFKSEAIETFFAISEAEREGIFRTLQKVRLHITDPRPYMADIEDAITKTLPKGISFRDFLRRYDDSTQHLNHIREKTLNHIAYRMLDDAPAQRLRNRVIALERAVHASAILAADEAEEMGIKTVSEPQSFDYDLKPFQHPNASVLKDVAKFVSASASVFTPAIDRFDDACRDVYIYSPMAAPYLLNHALSPSHAFDEGNEKSIKWIEEQRTSVLTGIDRSRQFYYDQPPEALQALVSEKSVPIQVADIAAGIARELWSRNSLVHLVRRFVYITYNGQRLSENIAASHEKSFTHSLSTQ